MTIIVRGDVAACQASAEAGAAAAAAVGKLTAHNVMPRPERGVHAIVATHGIEALPDRRLKALGMIETFGIVYVLEAVDAMIKSSGVELIGYENVASGYISVLVEGDVSACRTAVEAGVLAVGRMGAQVYSSVVIPSPHPPDSTPSSAVTRLRGWPRQCRQKAGTLLMVLPQPQTAPVLFL